MKEKRSTRERVKRMMEGMLYHCTDMTNFMSETLADPYFETEEGMRMRRYMIGILNNHAMALMEFMTSKGADVEQKESKFSLEDFLRDSFN